MIKKIDELPLWAHEARARVDLLSQKIARYARKHGQGKYVQSECYYKIYTASNAAILEDDRTVDIAYTEPSFRLGFEFPHLALNPLDFPSRDYALQITINPNRGDQIGYVTCEKSLFGILDSIYYFDLFDRKRDLSGGSWYGEGCVLVEEESENSNRDGQIICASTMERLNSLRKKYFHLRQMVVAALERKLT